MVKCDCGNEQVVFGNATAPVKCLQCKRKLIVSTGGRAKVLGKVVKVL